MANFNFNKLYLVKPCKLDDDCYARAMHGINIIDNAEIFKSFKEAVKDLDYLVATSSIDHKRDKKHLRSPIFLDSFAEKIFEVEGKVGLIFGREDYGLFNEEIAKCDIMLRIPSSDSYRSLNLSHAVTLVLYALFVNKDFKPRHRRKIGKIEKEKLYEYFAELLENINYPEHKKEKTKIMFKRIMGRAMPSKWEYHTLMGVLSNTLNRLKNKDTEKKK